MAIPASKEQCPLGILRRTNNQGKTILLIENKWIDKQYTNMAKILGIRGDYYVFSFPEKFENVNVDDASPASNAIGGEMLLKTATTGGTLTTALTINSSQDVIINSSSATTTLKMINDTGSQGSCIAAETADGTAVWLRFTTTDVSVSTTSCE